MRPRKSARPAGLCSAGPLRYGPRIWGL